MRKILIFLFCTIMAIKIQSVGQIDSKIILGIDPGTLVMGYAIMEVKGNHLRLIEMNVLKLSSKIEHFERLKIIHNTVESLINIYQPNHFAIEAPFFGKNVQSMLKLGRAQGVAVAAAMRSGLTVMEYSPKKVKQSVTGNGNANKEQIWQMLRHMLSIKTEKPQYYDATDALAVAVCHHLQQKSVTNGLGKKGKGWEDFLKTNPERITKK